MTWITLHVSDKAVISQGSFNDQPLDHKMAWHEDLVNMARVSCVRPYWGGFHSLIDFGVGTAIVRETRDEIHRLIQEAEAASSAPAPTPPKKTETEIEASCRAGAGGGRGQCRPGGA